jgi:histone acetyltransferase
MTTTQQLLNAIQNPQQIPAPPTFRDSRLHQDVQDGSLHILLVLPDGSPESWKLLTALKGIFQKQLPKMPREYVSRLVYDRRHRSVALARSNPGGGGPGGYTIIGGITYRLFPEGEFAEIVFCAISSTDQVKGYGGFLMSHLKEQVKNETNRVVKHFLTYADNYAVGYFKKQGFTKYITLERELWAGRIKDYEGGTLMQCTMVAGINYLHLYPTYWEQKIALMQQVNERTRCAQVFRGIDPARFPLLKGPEGIPGLLEAGWTPEMSKLASAPRRGRLFQVLKSVMPDLKKHPASWPFLQPVDPKEVPDYYDIITTPMDLATMELKLEQEVYTSLVEFGADFKLVVSNCQTYNNPETTYYKNASILESYFRERIKNKDVK